MAEITRFDDCLCGVCHRQAAGVGHMPKGYNDKPILWICDDPSCIQPAKDSYKMKQQEFSRIETLAALDAATMAGEWLVALGKGFDFEKLAPEEYDEFIKQAIAGYRVALKNRIINNEAPF